MDLLRDRRVSRVMRRQKRRQTIGPQQRRFDARERCTLHPVAARKFDLGTKRQAAGHLQPDFPALRGATMVPG
jgi:hypothetical protein